MIAAYLVFFVLGAVVFFLLAKFGLPIKLMIALAVFLIPSIVFTVWVIRTGDKPPPDAITVFPKHSEGSSKKDSEE